MSDQPGAVALALTQQKLARPVDPEQLEMFGKRAAALYGTQGTPLTEAVVETIKEARLAPEQIKRVCEFANTTAFLSAFEKAGEVRNITFDRGPASPGDVIRSLNDGSAPAINHLDDYRAPVGSYKAAAANDSLLAEAFLASGGMEKAASVTESAGNHADPRDDLDDLRVRLESTRDYFTSKLSHARIILEDVRDDLHSAVQSEKNAGTPSASIIEAWSHYAPDVTFLKDAMDVLRDGESTEPVKTAHVSGKIPNPTHPVVERFVALTKVAAETRKLEQAVGIVDEQLHEVHKTLRSALT